MEVRLDVKTTSEKETRALGINIGDCVAVDPRVEGSTPFGRNAAALEALRAEFARWPKVAETHVDSDWARRLDGLLTLGRYAVLMLASTLALALVAITFNTIRLQILTQRDEIEVAKLIGATDGYIQRPFLYLGSMIGGAGGAAAWLMVCSVLLVFNGQLRPLGELYGMPLQLGHLSVADSVVALLFAGTLGRLVPGCRCVAT